MNYLFKNICNIKSSKRIFANQYCETGIPFYRGKEIIEKSNNKTVKTELYISEETYKNISLKFPIPKSNDILITAVGTLGVSYLVKETDLPFYFKDGNLIWLSDFNNKIIPQYLYYYLKSLKFTNIIESICIGSTQKAITIHSLGNISIYVPSISDQQHIVDIMYCLKCLIIFLLILHLSSINLIIH